MYKRQRGRQCDKDQAWSAAGIDLIREAGRKDDQSGNKSDKCIQDDDIQALRDQRVILFDIAAEDRQCADTEAERKECLPQRFKDDRAQRIILQCPLKIRNELERQTFLCAGERKACLLYTSRCV